MGKGSNSTQTVQQADPWSGQQPYLTDSFRQAQSLYNSGGPQYFPNATYVPFSTQTQDAMSRMQNRAMGGSPVEGAMQNYVTNTLNQQPGGGTQEFLSGMMSGSSMPQYGQSPGFTDQLRSMAGQEMGLDSARSMMGVTPAMDMLEKTAAGGFLGSNPYLDSQYDAAARRVTENFTDNVIPGITGMFAGSGGTGSGIHREMNLDAADVLGQNLSDMAANMYGQNYAQERSRQLQAAGQMSADDLSRTGMASSLYGTQRGQNLSAAGQAAGLDSSNFQQDANRYSSDFNQDLARQLQAAGLSNQLTGIQGDIARGAAALAPTAANFDYQNIDRLMGVGSQVEGMAGNILQDQMNRFNYYQQAPEQNLARYIAAIQGNYGGTTMTEQDAGSNPLAGAAGGAMLGAALPSMFPGTFSQWGTTPLGPWGMLGGAVLGGLLS